MALISGTRSSKHCSDKIWDFQCFGPTAQIGTWDFFFSNILKAFVAIHLYWLFFQNVDSASYNIFFFGGGGAT